MTSRFSLNCSKCDSQILKSNGDSVKLRAKVIVVKDDATFAVCKGCNSEIQVPFVLDEALAKSIAINEPRLYLSK